ncbi:MAG: type II toxin-antitoxin system RelE/ParE family toxin [Gammaproteobacteria bacterium]|nr:type II toxin-antitoxin system RelE/ParE family toxin [Gammaproteobacteria bacterium]
MKITYTPEAIRDLIRLREFIENKNPQAAQRVAETIRNKIQQLKTFPLMGVEVEEAPDPEMIRDLIMGHYIVRYLVHSNEVHILRIWHHKERRL